MTLSSQADLKITPTSWKWFFLGFLLCVLPCSGSTFLTIIFTPTSQPSTLQWYSIGFAAVLIPCATVGLLIMAVESRKDADVQAVCVMILIGIGCGIVLTSLLGSALRDYRIRRLGQVANVAVLVNVIEDYVQTQGEPPESIFTLGSTRLPALREVDLGDYALDYYTVESVPRRFENELNNEWVIVITEPPAFIDYCFFTYDVDASDWEFDSCE